MKRLLKILPVIVLFVSGLFAGDWMRTSVAGTARDDARASRSGDISSYKFPTPFYVPIVRNGSLRAAMVLELGLDVSGSGQEAVSKQELQLRDSLLRALMIHANTGGFDGNFTSEAHLNLLADTLLTAARRIVGDDAKKILIVNIARQNR